MHRAQFECMSFVYKRKSVSLQSVYIHLKQLTQVLCGATNYDLKIDVWSFAIVMLHVNTQHRVFCWTETEMIIKIVALIGSPTSEDIEVSLT